MGEQIFETGETKRRSLWITIFIVVVVVVGYAAVLVIGGNALRDAPFARQILGARDRIQSMITFEPPNNIARPPLESGALAITPSPIQASPQPSLSPSVVPPPVDAPSILTFTVEFENTTGVQLTDVIITNRIPSGSAYRSNSATPQATFDGSRLVWHVGTLPAGAVGKVTFQVIAPKDTRVTNVAVMSSNEAPDSSIETTANVN